MNKFKWGTPFMLCTYSINNKVYIIKNFNFNKLLQNIGKEV